MPDGHPASPNDPIKPVSRFVDAVLQVWHHLYRPGSLLVADETMVGWTGATNIHITMLPNKPTSQGVCLKTFCEASTHVMINYFFSLWRACWSRESSATQRRGSRRLPAADKALAQRHPTHPACRCVVWRPPDVREAYAPGLLRPLQTSKPTPSTFTRRSAGQTLVVATPSVSAMLLRTGSWF
jgi:hypothetical protein